MAAAARARSAASIRASVNATASACSVVKRAGQRRLSRRGDRLAPAAQLGDALVSSAACGIGRQLGERGVERHQQLERGLAPAAVIEIQARTQRQLLAGQRLLARAQHGGQPRLRLSTLHAPAAGRR